MLTSRRAPPRRAPYPGDIKVNGQLMMLGVPAGPDGNPKEGARLVSTKPGDLDKVTPSSYGYSAMSPLFERVQEYAHFELGYGQRVQQSEADRRYYYALGVDASVSGVLMKGPKITSVTPATRDSTHGITRPVELNGTLYVVDGRYVLERVSDASFTVAKDFGAGKACTDAIVFHSNMDGGAEYAYFAMGDEEAVWRAGPGFEVQTVAVSGTPTGGVYSLQWNGYTTKAIAYDANAATVQAALREIPGLEFVEVASTGATPNYTHAVTFTGVTDDPPQLTSTSSGLTGGTPSISHATTTAYVAVEWKQRVSVQTIAVSGTPTGGTFVVQYGNLATASLAYDVGAAGLQTALRALAGLASVEVTAAGTSPDLTYTIAFAGVGYEATTLTSTNNLTGGTTPTLTHATTKRTLRALCWAIKGREFYRASNTNEVAKVNTDADPFQEENWTEANAFTAGDKSARVVRMQINAAGTLVIFKLDGMYVLDEDGDDTHLFPDLQLAHDADGAEALGNWMNDQYVSYGGGLYQLTFDLRLDQVGPETITTNDSPVRGKITAVCGHDAFNLYAGIHNPDTGDSYLMKYGGWLTPPDDVSRKVPIWHGSISVAFAGKKITMLHKSAIGAPTGYTRMWIGFSDGTYGYFVLPITPNPAASAEYLFDADNDGEFYLPQFNGIFRADPKNYRAITITSLNATPSTYAQAEYRTEPDDDFSAVGEDFNNSNRQRIGLPSTASGRTLDLKILLINTADTASPQVTAILLHFQIRPALFLVHQFVVLAEDGLLMRNRVPLKISGNNVRDIVKGLVSSTANPTITLPDQSEVEVAFISYEETVAWDQVARQWRAGLQIQATEVVLTDRGTYARLELYSYGDLSAYTYSQIEGL